MAVQNMIVKIVILYTKNVAAYET